MKLLLAIAGLALSTGTASFSLAATDDRPFFDYTDVSPGEWISDTVLIQNTGPDPIDLRVYRAAGHATADGDWTLRGNDGAAQWIVWNDDIYTVPGESALKVDFAVSVPEGAPEGEYLAGLIAEPVDWKQAAGEGFMISVLPQSGLAIRVTVGQPTDCQIVIDGLRTIQRNLIYMDLSNLGNYHFTGAGRFILSGPEDFQADLGLRHFPAFGGAPYQIILPDLEPGDYTVSARIWSHIDAGCQVIYNGVLTIGERPEQPEEPTLLEEIFGLSSAQAEDGSGAAFQVSAEQMAEAKQILVKGIGVAALVLAAALAVGILVILKRRGRRKGVEIVDLSGPRPRGPFEINE